MAPGNDKKKYHLKLISILAALLLWFYVTNASDGGGPNKFIPVKLQYRNTPPDFSLVAPEHVGVRVWSGQSINTDNIVAYVDLQGLGQGRHERTVQLQPVEGALFTKVEPDTIELELVPQQKLQLPVEIEVLKEPADNFKIVDNLVTPDFCLIQGDSEALKKLKRITVEVDLSKSTGGVVKQSLAVIPKDANNNVLSESLRLIPNEVEVLTVVEEDRRTKEVPLQHNLTGQPSVGYKLGKVTLEPQKASVIGNKTVLAGIQKIRLKPVNINEHNESFTTFAEIEPVTGVLIYPKQVKITIEVLPEEKPPKDEEITLKEKPVDDEES